MIAFKGFNENMTGMDDFQYNEGEEYTESEVNICKNGFHACKYPLDCFNYYYPNSSEYHIVDLDNGEDDVQSDEKDSKICGKHIKIGAKLNIVELVKASIEYTNKHVDTDRVNNKHHGTSSVTCDYGTSLATGNWGTSSATGDYSASSATGDCGTSSATGDYGASSVTGEYSISSTTGYCSASSTTGCCSISAATGCCSASAATGEHDVSLATGKYGASSATGECVISSATGYFGASSVAGNCSVSLATGYCGTSSAESNHSIAVSFGIKGRAKGVKGAYIVLADWTIKNNVITPNRDNQDDWDFNGAKMVQIDDINYKSNTWYTIKNHEIVEWNNKNSMLIS